MPRACPYACVTIIPLQDVVCFESMKLVLPFVTLSIAAVSLIAVLGFKGAGSNTPRPSLKGLTLVKGASALPKTELAAFSGGCFWGVEDSYRHVPGVVATEVGFTGGHTKNPTYEEVCSRTTGHLETVLVEFDPSKVSYKTLVDDFWKMHDPTQADGQGPDQGEQYHSAIWCYTPEQQKEAAESRDQLQASGKLGKAQITTRIALAKPFYRAEEYHQQYAEKNGRVMCKLPGYGG